jgi:hypothetical protein
MRKSPLAALDRDLGPKTGLLRGSMRDVAEDEIAPLAAGVSGRVMCAAPGSDGHAPSVIVRWQIVPCFM